MARTEHLVMEPGQMEKNFTSPNPFVRHVYNQRLAAVVNFLPCGGGLKVLDAGCGEGHLLAAMAERLPMYELYGVDVTATALAEAHQRAPRAILARQDIEHLNFPDNFFEAVCCVEVLEHIYEYRAVCRQLARVTKPGGVVIIAFPNDFWWTVGRFFLRRRPYRVPDHVNFLTPRKVARAIGWPIWKKKYILAPAPFFWCALNPILVFKKPETV